MAKCGNTDDYDMDRFWNGPVQVRSLKIRLFSGLKKQDGMYLKLLKMEMKRQPFPGYHGCCLQRTFILAEDWEPEQILPAIEEMDARDQSEKNCCKQYL